MNITDFFGMFDGRSNNKPGDVGSGIPDKSLDVWRLTVAGYAGYDDGVHNIGKSAEYKRRWTDKGNVQVLTGTDAGWIEGNGYVAPEMVVIPEQGLPKDQQKPPFLNLYDEYDPQGSPLGFTQKLFARNGKVSLLVETLDKFELDGAQEYELWVWLYPYSEYNSEPRYNTGVYRVTMSIGGTSDTFELPSNEDHILAMPVYGPKIDQAKFLFEILEPSNQDVSHSLFVKAYGLIKTGEQQQPEPTPEPEPVKLPYVATVNLISQAATYAQAEHLFSTAFDMRRTYTFSHDDAIAIVTQAMEGSKINVIGERNTADFEAMNAAGAAWEYFELPDVTQPTNPDDTWDQGMEYVNDVPFVSQMGEGASYYNDCGPASCAMIYQYYTGKPITPEQITREMDAINRVTGVSENIQWLNRQGIKTNYYGPYDTDGPVSEQALINATVLGRPFFLLVDYPELPASRVNKSYDGWHFFICYGFSDSKEHGLRFYIHDPLSPADRTWLLPWPELERALVGDGRNLARQGFTAYIEKKTEEQPPKPEEPSGEKLDILDYMLGEIGHQYVMKHTVTGGQERYRYEDDPNPPAGALGGFYIVKNHLWERYAYDDEWIYLVEDCSPDRAEDGTDRFYRVTDPNGGITPYCPRFMAEGQHWQGPLHKVQFYSVDDCSPHPQNSGEASNLANLRTDDAGFITDEKYVSGAYIELVVNNERQFFEYGVGRIAWVSAWGSFEKTPEDVSGQTWIPKKELNC